MKQGGREADGRGALAIREQDVYTPWASHAPFPSWDLGSGMDPPTLRIPTHVI